MVPELIQFELASSEECVVINVHCVVSFYPDDFNLGSNKCKGCCIKTLNGEYRVRESFYEVRNAISNHIGLLNSEKRGCPRFRER